MKIVPPSISSVIVAVFGLQSCNQNDTSQFEIDLGPVNGNIGRTCDITDEELMSLPPGLGANCGPRFGITAPIEGGGIRPKTNLIDAKDMSLDMRNSNLELPSSITVGLTLEYENGTVKANHAFKMDNNNGIFRFTRPYLVDSWLAQNSDGTTTVRASVVPFEVTTVPGENRITWQARYAGFAIVADSQSWFAGDCGYTLCAGDNF